MKKIISIILASLLAFAALTGCSAGGNAGAKNDTIQIVTTFFPEYDWVMNVLGSNPGNIEVTNLLESGADIHSYQPTVSDIVKISSADIFIYVGGESDEWVDDVLKQASDKDMIVINLIDILGDSAKEEEIIEGMEAEEEEEGEEVEYDEHVWLSLKNAKLFVSKIEASIETVDPANASSYKSNCDNYIDQLNKLDESYEETVKEGSRNILLFADRFPFRYMIDDYGLSYYAAFVGCSSETQASFKTITFLSEKVEENSLPYIMTIEGENHSIAEAVIQNTSSQNQKILEMNSMQSVTLKNINDGDTYLSIMQNNLEVLKEALN